MNALFFSMIIRSYLMNYPVIDCILKKNKVVCVVVDDINEIMERSNEIFGDAVVIDEDMGVPKLKTELMKCNMNGAVLVLRNSKKMTAKSIEKIETVKAMLKYKSVDSEYITAGAILLCEGGISREYIRDCFTVYVPDLDFSEINSYDFGEIIVPRIEDLQEIFESVCVWNSKTEEFAPFSTACLFLKPGLNRHNSKKLFDDVFEISKDLDCHKYEEPNEEELVEGFEQLLINFQKNKNFEVVAFLPNLEKDEIEKFETGAFINKDILYISRRIFKEIAASLLSYTTEKRLCNALRNGGILMCYDNGYVKKMNYINAYGQSAREYMMALNMAEIVDDCGNCLTVYFSK